LTNDLFGIEAYLALTGLDGAFANYQGLRAPRSTPGYFICAPLGRRAHIPKCRNLGNDKAPTPGYLL